MGRAPCCDKSLVKKGPWSPEEDAMLKAYIDAHGTGGNWIALPQKIGIKRCGKSCRLRWLNYLRPNLKHGGFSDDEDNIICSLYISIGSRWSVIAAQLPGRTDNDIKNYWNTKLKKKLLGRRKQGSNNMLSSSSSLMDGGRDAMSDETQRLSNSALERLQLHIQLQNQNSSDNDNGPTFWPKLLHPAQERMIKNLTAMHNDNNTPYSQNHNSFPKTGSQSFDGLIVGVGVSSNQINSTMHGLEQLVGTPSCLSGFQLQAEFEDFFKTTTNLDKREEGHGVWWSSSEMDTKSSASISSDDSNSVIASGGHMMFFHDHGQGGYYNNM